MNERELLKWEYEQINQKDEFSKLKGSGVFDNAGGNSSSTANKTSIYLFGGEKCLVRMVNISTKDIDGVDDFPVYGNILIVMIAGKVGAGTKHHIRMNENAYSQFIDWWYSQKECETPIEIKSLMGCEIVIDNHISNNQEAVT